MTCKITVDATQQQWPYMIGWYDEKGIITGLNITQQQYDLLKKEIYGKMTIEEFKELQKSLTA